MTNVYISRPTNIQVKNLNASLNMYEKSLKCITLNVKNVLNSTQKSRAISFVSKELVSK